MDGQLKGDQCKRDAFILTFISSKVRIVEEQCIKRCLIL